MVGSIQVDRVDVLGERDGITGLDLCMGEEGKSLETYVIDNWGAANSVIKMPKGQAS